MFYLNYLIVIPILLVELEFLSPQQSKKFDNASESMAILLPTYEEDE